MGDLGEYWRDAKEYQRQQKNKYEQKISGVLNQLIAHPECKKVGTQWRIGGVWDFWWTGTVRNIKTGQEISIYKLAKLFPSPNQ